MKPLLPILGVLALSSSVAHANPSDDFAFELKEMTGEYYSAWVLTKLTTFKIGPQCWEKVVDGKKYNAVHFASFYTRDIAEYAKTVTGDDWSSIESQSGDREKNKALVEPLMDSFKARFSVTISVEGKDCGATSDALWMRYWTTLGTAVKDYPPKASKVTIKLNVTSKAKDVTATVDKSGSTFVITAPRDIEPAAWDTKITAPFKKAAKKI